MTEHASKHASANCSTPEQDRHYWKKFMQYALPGMFLLDLGFMGAFAVSWQQLDGQQAASSHPILLGILTMAAGIGAVLLFVVYPASLIRMGYLAWGPKSAMAGHCPMPYAAREALRQRQRSEHRRVLTFCAILLGLQLVILSVYYVGWGRHKTFPHPMASTMAGLVFPVGWMVPILMLASLVRGRRYRRDLAGGELHILRGVIEKRWPAATDGGELYPDQYIRIQGEPGTFTVPKALWERLPPSSEGVCEYFPQTRIVYRINGCHVCDADTKRDQNS